MQHIDTEQGYSFYKKRGCSGRNEIFTGRIGSRNGCRRKCDIKMRNKNSCVSFEWWGVGNEHPNNGPKYCQISSSCTFELANQTKR